MKIIKQLRRKIKPQIDRSQVKEIAYDTANAYPLTAQQISENKVLMEFYRQGYNEGLEETPRRKFKSHLFQEAYDVGYREGYTDF